MSFTANETVEPFWAEFSSAASGRDPLAIQNSSVVIEVDGEVLRLPRQTVDKVRLEPQIGKKPVARKK